MAASLLSPGSACEDRKRKGLCFREQHCLITADLLRMSGTGKGPAEAFWRPRVHRSNLTHKKKHRRIPERTRLSALAEGHPGELEKINTLQVIWPLWLSTPTPAPNFQHHSSPLTPQLPFTIQAKAMTSISHYLGFFFPHGQADPVCSSVLPRLITSTHTHTRTEPFLILFFHPSLPWQMTFNPIMCSTWELPWGCDRGLRKHICSPLGDSSADLDASPSDMFQTWQIGPIFD